MNRTFIAVCGAVMMSAALLGAQSQEKASTDSNNGGAGVASVTFRGCLNPGSTADTYYLTSAKEKGVKNSDKTVKIVAAKKGALEPFVTQEVEVTGTIDQATAPAASSDEASKVRTLTVTKVKSRADYCG